MKTIHSLINFTEKLFNRFGELVLKLLGSRVSLFQIVQKVFAAYILLGLKNETHILVLFGLSSICDFVYFGMIRFAPVKASISIATPGAPQVSGDTNYASSEPV